MRVIDRADFDELVEDSPDVRNYLQIVAERRVRDAYKRTHSEKSMVGRDALNDVSSVHDGLSSAESLAAARERSQEKKQGKRRSFTTSNSASSALSAALAAAGAHSGCVPGPKTTHSTKLLNPAEAGSNINLVEFVETGKVQSRNSSADKTSGIEPSVDSSQARQATRVRPHLRHAISTNSTMALENAMADMEQIEQVCDPDALPLPGDMPIDPAAIKAVQDAHLMVGNRMTTVEKRITMLETSASQRHDALTRMIQEMSHKIGTPEPQSRSNWETPTGFGYEHTNAGGNTSGAEGNSNLQVDGSDQRGATGRGGGEANAGSDDRAIVSPMIQEDEHAEKGRDA